MNDIGPMPALSAAERDGEAPSRAAQAGTAALAFCVGTFLATAVYVPVALTRPDPDRPPAFVVVVAVPLAWVLARVLAPCVVLPLVRLAASAARRTTGRFGGWWLSGLAASAGIAAGSACVLAGGGLPAGGWTALAVAGSLACTGVPVWVSVREERRARTTEVRDRIWLTAGLGFVAVVTASVLLFTVGPLDVYRPPVLTRAQLVGTWSDGHGGSVRLDPDGFIEAVRLHDRATGSALHVVLGPGCTLSGTWSFDPGRAGAEQEVDTEGAEECGTAQWAVLGTVNAPQLSMTTGDLDSGAYYTLTRRRQRLSRSLRDRNR